MLRLKHLRKSAKMTQQHLATLLGITQATLSGWENEKFEIDINSEKKFLKSLMFLLIICWASVTFLIIQNWLKSQFLVKSKQ